MNKRVVGVLLLSIWSAGVMRADETEPPLLSEAICEQIKKTPQHTAADKVFEQAPEVAPAQKLWWLSLKDIFIPVLPGTYPVHEKTVGSGPHPRFDAVLKRSDGLVIRIALEPMPKYKDAFELTPIKHSAAAGERRTVVLYGRPPSFLDLETEAYSYQRKDLICADLNTLQRERLAIALQLKTTESEWNPFTLHVVGGKSVDAFWGITRWGEYGNRWGFQRELPFETSLLRVTYLSPDRSELSTLYQGSWTAVEPSDLTTPAWLQQIAAAMLDWSQHPTVAVRP